MQKGGVVDRQLVKGSSLPSDEQRTLLGYASRHPKSALHSTGRRHDAAVLLIHGIGYQNFGETLDYFGKPVAHSLKTLATMASATAPDTGSDAADSPEEATRGSVTLIPDGDTQPPSGEVTSHSEHRELSYALTLEYVQAPEAPETPETLEVSESTEVPESPEDREAVDEPSTSSLQARISEGLRAQERRLQERLSVSRSSRPERPERSVVRRSILLQEGFWRPKHYRPLRDHLPWLVSVLPLFLMFCLYYERPGRTWTDRAGQLLRSIARFVNVAGWLVLAVVTIVTMRDAFVASLSTSRGLLTALVAVLSLGILGWVLARRARELWALVKAIPTQLIQTATSPESRDLERIYARLDRQLDLLVARSDAPGIIAHSQGGYLGYELLRRRAKAGKKPLRFFYGLGNGVVPISIIASDRNDVPAPLDSSGGFRNRLTLLALGAVAGFAWVQEALLLVGPYASLLRHMMLIPLTLGAATVVFAVLSALKGRGRIAQETGTIPALWNVYGTRSLIKWLIPTLFVHGVFMMFTSLMLVLAYLSGEARVPAPTALGVAFWCVVMLAIVVSVRSCCHLFVRAYAPSLHEMNVADHCEIAARGDSIGRSNITQPTDVKVTFATLPGPSVSSHMQYFDASSPVPLMLSRRLLPHVLPADTHLLEGVNDIGAELNRAFARAKRVARAVHYGLYAGLTALFVLLLNAASLLHVSAQAGLDVPVLDSAGFEWAVAAARYLREQVDSPGGGLALLAILFAVEVLLVVVLSPATQRRFQRFMVTKIDRTLARESVIGGVDDEASAASAQAWRSLHN